MTSKFKPGDIVQAGKPGTAEHDTGTVAAVGGGVVIVDWNLAKQRYTEDPKVLRAGVSIEVHGSWPCAVTDRDKDFICEACLRLCCPCFGGDDDFECLCDECWCLENTCPANTDKAGGK